MGDALIITGSLSRLSLPLLRWCPKPVVMVEARQADDYRSSHPGIEFVTLPDERRGFGYLMNRIVDEADRRGHRYFVFTDDDVTDLRSRPTVVDKFAPARGPLARATLAALVEEADRDGLAQLAVSFSGQSWAAKQATVEPTGAWGVHVTSVDAVRAVGGYDEALPIFNDWELSARLLRAGHRTRRTNLVSFVHKMRSHDGGASALYDRAETIRAAAEDVAARYPEAASVKFIPAHGLHEVRFNWRKLRITAANG